MLEGPIAEEADIPIFRLDVRVYGGREVVAPRGRRCGSGGAEEYIGRSIVVDKRGECKGHEKGGVDDTFEWRL